MQSSFTVKVVYRGGHSASDLPVRLFAFVRNDSVRCWPSGRNKTSSVSYHIVAAVCAEWLALVNYYDTWSLYLPRLSADLTASCLVNPAQLSAVCDPNSPPGYRLTLIVVSGNHRFRGFLAHVSLADVSDGLLAVRKPLRCLSSVLHCVHEKSNPLDNVR